MNVIAWVFMVIMIIASLTKVGSTLYNHRTLRLDDFLLAIATVGISVNLIDTRKADRSDICYITDCSDSGAGGAWAWN